MRRRLLFSISFLTLLSLGSCSDKPTDPGRGGSSVIVLNEMGPANGSSGQPLMVVLRWMAPDSLRDSLTYDVYFGSQNRVLVDSAIGVNYWQSSVLDRGSSYQWEVIAHDSNDSSFTTGVQRFSTVDDGATIRGYPIAIGNSWEYLDSSRIENGIDVDTSYLNLIRQNNGPTIVEIVNDTALNLTGTLAPYFVFANRYQFERAGSCVDTVYYNYTDGDLMSFRFGRPCQSLIYTPRVIPGSADLSRIDDRLRLVSMISKFPGDLYRETNQPEPFATLSFKFPMRLGSTWRMRDPGFSGEGANVYIDKTVIAFENVTVGAETVECAVVRWRYSGVAGGLFRRLIVTDYVADIGLVKRKIAFLDINGRDELNNPIGVFDDIHELKLLSYSIAAD